MNKGDIEYRDGPFAWNDDCEIASYLDHGLMLWERGDDMSYWNDAFDRAEISSKIKTF